MTIQVSYIEVTEDMINAASRIETNSIISYRVRNSQGNIDEQGEIIEYTVAYDAEHSCLTCTCPAGMNGRTCWHVRAAAAHSAWFAREMRRINQDERETLKNDPTYLAEYREYQAWHEAQADAAQAKRDARAARALQANRNKGFQLLK